MTTSSASATMTTTSPASFDNPRISELERRLADVRATIRAQGRNPDDVRIVAVTKTFPWSYVRAAGAVGLIHVGENYLGELASKRGSDGAHAMVWHYLGTLQTNKIAKIAAVADVISGVSRIKEVEKLASLAACPALDIQVDTTGRLERNGASPDDVAMLVGRARALGLVVRGLMVVAPPEPTAAAASFGLVDALCRDLGIVERSMGMSEDYALACARGSTELRLGRALFGPRDDRAPKA